MSDRLDRDFEVNGNTYSGKIRKQEGAEGGWTFMAFRDGAPFGPPFPDIPGLTADEAMDKGIEAFVEAGSK